MTLIHLASWTQGEGIFVSSTLDEGGWEEGYLNFLTSVY